MNAILEVFEKVDEQVCMRCGCKMDESEDLPEAVEIRAGDESVTLCEICNDDMR